MSSRRRTWQRAGALTGCALSLLACSPASDVASLGTYFERSEDDEADARSETAPDAGTDASSDTAPDANDSGSALTDGSSDAGRPDGSSDDVDPFPADAPPCARTGCVSSEAPAQTDPSVHCQTVVVGAGSSPPIPPGSPANHFVGFNFTPQIHGTEYLRSISPIVDDAKVLHHMKLSQLSTAPAVPDEPGAAIEPRQFPFPARLLYSWAPGGSALFLDPTVGIAVLPDTNYVAEFHYGDQADKVFDGSGFRICFTPTAPKHLVSFSGLRAKGPPGALATGTCSVQHSGPTVLLSAQPNSNSIGSNVEVVRERPGSSALSVLDEPYDHDFVPYRALSVLLQAGDTLSTRCDYIPPIPQVIDARCEITMLHWPAHTLVSGSDAGQTSEWENCTQ